MCTKSPLTDDQAWDYIVAAIVAQLRAMNDAYDAKQETTSAVSASPGGKVERTSDTPT